MKHAPFDHPVLPVPNRADIPAVGGGASAAARDGLPRYHAAVRAACPWGSADPFAGCGGPFLAGAHPDTPVALMRSGYPAYLRGAIDSLTETHDVSTRREVD